MQGVEKLGSDLRRLSAYLNQDKACSVRFVSSIVM